MLFSGNVASLLHNKESEMDKLRGKVAVATGGAGCMGRAYALRLALLGADVAIVDIDLNVSSGFWRDILSAE
jgi:D-arabinose 5-phosphate isomerase GutQ